MADSLDEELDSHQDPTAPPSTPADDGEGHFKNDIKAMEAVIHAHSSTSSTTYKKRADSWDRQVAEAEGAINMLDQTLQVRSGLLNQNI